MRVLICQNYTEYITNKERVTGPISASKLFFDKSILDNLLYRSKLGKPSICICTMCCGGGGGGLTMVSGKGYKGSPMWSVVKLATSPSPPQTILKTEQNAAGNEASMGATLTGAERRMEGWTQFKPNVKLSLRAESHATWKLRFFYSVPSSLNLILIHKLFPCLRKAC